MKNLVLSVFILTFFAAQQSHACITILCEAICAKYRITQDSVNLGKNGEEGTFSGESYFQLVNSRTVYLEGEKSYAEIFNELKKQCSGSNELLFESDEDMKKTYNKLPSNNLKASKACVRIEDSPAKQAVQKNSKSKSGLHQN